MSKEYCCCGSIHVKTGALIIGYLVIVFGIIGLLASIVLKTDANKPTMQQPDDATTQLGTVNIIGIVRYALSVIIGGCIIYADRSRKPGGYLPYLILTAISIVIYTVFIVILVIMAIFTQYVYHAEIDPKRQPIWWGLESWLFISMSKIFFFVAAVTAFVEWISIWFWMVVYRAYQHMKGVEEYDRGQTYQVKFNDV